MEMLLLIWLVATILLICHSRLQRKEIRRWQNNYSHLLRVGYVKHTSGLGDDLPPQQPSRSKDSGGIDTD